MYKQAHEPQCTKNIQRIYFIIFNTESYRKLLQRNNLNPVGKKINNEGGSLGRFHVLYFALSSVIWHLSHTMSELSHLQRKDISLKIRTPCLLYKSSEFLKFIAWNKKYPLHFRIGHNT